MRKEQFSIRVAPDLLQKIGLLAKKERRSKAEIIDRMIEASLAGLELTVNCRGTEGPVQVHLDEILVDRLENAAKSDDRDFPHMIVHLLKKGLLHFEQEMAARPASEAEPKADTRQP